MLTGGMASPVPGIDRVHLPVVVIPRRLSPWRWLAPFLLAALALRMIPLLFGETAGSLPEQALVAPGIAANPIERPGESFPGSAYFYAEGGFDSTPSRASARGLDPQWQGNKHILAIDIGPPAAPYRFAGRSALDRVRALSCLTNAIYYEAANEPEEGQRAVAQVVLNRLRHPAWPNSVCGVVYEGTERADLRCQFTFSCDGSMGRAPVGDRWARARRVAERALNGEVFTPAGLATYYHTLTVFPAWARQMHASAIIGAHIFYRAPGADGMPQRFGDRYTGIETIEPGLNAYLSPRQEIAETAPIIPATGIAAAPVAGVPPPEAQMPPASPALPSSGVKGLPQSGDIKPEYRNSGRPLSGSTGPVANH